MSDLLNLLILFNFLHDLVIFLGQKCSLPFDDFADLLLLIIGEIDFALIEKCAHELATFNLLRKLPLANVKEFITLFCHNSVITLLPL